MQNQKESWARLSIVSNSILVVLKIIVGILTGSVSIVAEGLHSGVDLAASVITFFGVKVSGRGADKDHHFGHGKFESFSALVETGLLVVTCLWIVSEAIDRLVNDHPQVQASAAGFAVMGL